jgi:hypothetical protein
VYKQAATAAELDALSLAYQGETQAQGLLTEAKITRASRPSWTQGILQAMSLGIGGYASAGGTMRSPPSPSQLTGVNVTGRRVPTTLTTTSSSRYSGPR